MRIVIDMQGAQTESRYRGIGRYTLSLTQAIVRNRGEHEILLALNGLFTETIEPIRAAFEGVLPQEYIRVWHAAGPTLEAEAGNASRRLAAELAREAFIQSLEPDLIHIPSLFEGFDQDAVLSIGRLDKGTPVSVTLHDLIPLLNPEQYLDSNPPFAAYYRNKVDHLNRADLLLSISDSASQEAFECLGVSPDKVVNTSEAADPMFRVVDIPESARQALLEKLNIQRPFVLYSGGGDERKNLPRLIEAYARIPAPLRRRHQLVFAGRIPHGIVVSLQQHAREVGLEDGECLFTGYITDDELIRLYNLCHLYVFPSWHEGFGLPALEAMACGAPVIGANTSSLPEIIGHPRALFDPLDVVSITAKLQEVLEQEPLRLLLKEHGEEHARAFSWEASARKALSAWQALLANQSATMAYTLSASQEHLLAEEVREVRSWNKKAKSELSTAIALNQQAGLTRQLLLDVSEIRNNDAATGVQRVVRSYLQALLQAPPAGFQVVPVYATREEGYCYAWQMARQYGVALPDGLSRQALEDQAPIHWQRGDIFFALDMQHHVQLAHQAFFRQLQADGVTVKFLVHDLLPIQLADLFKDDDARQLHEQWLAMVAATDGAVCVSRATADAFDEWIEANGIFRTPGFRMAWVHNGGDLAGSRPSTGIPAEAEAVLASIRQRPTFLIVSTLEPRKGQELLFDAVQALWAQGQDVNLVLVGKQGWKIDTLASQLREHPENGKRLFWLEGISDEYLEKVYQASSALVAASINEGFGLSLIEAARYGISIIARDIPVFREVAQSSAFYFQGATGEALAEELSQWLDLYRQGTQPNSSTLHWQTWAQSAEQLKHALVAERYPRRQLLVDISELVKHDARSGIQRVVRSILTEWLRHPPEGYRVEPVYGSVDDGYRYARRFTLDFMGWPPATLEDELIDYAPGDIFFGLDMQPQVQIAQQPFYQRLRRQGVTVKFLLHDLLPIQMPEFFPPGNEEGFTQWLRSITATDGVICVSRTVADELREWVDEHGPARERPLQIGWSHNGADIDNSAPSKGMPDDAPQRLATLASRPSFLMVGTLEPRKGYTDTLDVFDALWRQGEDINLVIVGKMGWKVQELAERFKNHPEYDRRLFWLAGISDEYLERVYDASACLIAASYGEGFGLPLIEAAQKGLPIIARDIPVFREVAREHATYLPPNMKSETAGEIISQWVKAYRQGAVNSSSPMPWLTWKKSSRILLKKLQGKG
ncbi:glycosyltransferase family 4 protein [Modicisalibacter tunisiensis]|uniref:glycosyltransferase family 4 protein n=1 Tax=Modicisalibacter tunisiensis TaxID=390637 RepID=UPI001CC9607F|nr:glycosyltransferase family 1 protein [Modicisalibacter tunisiensis]MBZ9539949.1 glycosyltransferase family 4 protein [Modicisalibacter tunisiensis]